MKILVCISKVPDTTTKIRFTDDNSRFDESNVQFIINPLDEFALTRALEIKEAQGGQVDVINVGGADTEPLIRKALAIGADEAIRVDVEPTDAYLVASEIAKVAQDGGYEMVLTGRETIDHNGSQVGGMIAEIMDLPFISGVSKMDLDGSTAEMVREIEGGKETLSATAPFVASCQEGITEPRIPTMRGIMSARTKPLNTVAASGADQLTQVDGFESPPPKGDCTYIDKEEIGKLVDLLANEAKVI
jgi:electron transfer flavoprotein beta subunit